MPGSIAPFIVAHELTHALDDQYFDIDGMLEKTGGDDGRAAGWGGDRWQLYRRGDDTVTVLATLWDSDRDAREFRAALPRSMRRTILRRRDAVVVVTGEAGDRAAALAREALRAVRRAAGSLRAARS